MTLALIGQVLAAISAIYGFTKLISSWLKKPVETKQEEAQTSIRKQMDEVAKTGRPQ